MAEAADDREAVHVEESGESPDTPVAEAAAVGQATEEPVEQQIEDDGTILGVTVHYCDHIRIDPKYVSHPVVKVSIVDALTGKGINKFDRLLKMSGQFFLL